MKGKIFNAQEVQAIIAGTKTMFREVVKPKLDDRANCGLGIHDNGQLLWDARDDCGYYKNYDEIKCPYQVGQKIFVKESFWVNKKHGKFCWYDQDIFECGDSIIKKPAKHMEQEHSRLTLEITDVKVERLADISEEDVIKEGLDLDSEHSRLCLNIQDQPYSNDLIDGSAFKTIFAKNWNATHKKPEEKFEANPFVWVVDFKINK